jgi:hypothetical protein
MESNWCDIAQGSGSILGAVVAFIGMLCILKQINQANKNLKQNNHIAVYGINTEIYKCLSEHSHLRPYFYEGIPVPYNNKNEFLLISELLADFFEFIIVEKNSFSSEIQNPWILYINKIYSNSPGFRGFIKKNSDQYSNELLKYFFKNSSFNDGALILSRPVMTEAEFIEVDKIYQFSFKDSSVPTVTQKKWWSVYPNGIVGLFRDSEVIGGLSYWYISDETAKKFSEGRIEEKEIKILKKKSRNIYISDLAIMDDFRRKNYAQFILKKMFSESVKCKNLSSNPINIYALGYSISGKKLLAKIGFKELIPAQIMADKQPLYLLKLVSEQDLYNVMKLLI